MSRNTSSLPWLTGLAVLAAAGLWLILGPAPPSLVYDRAAIIQGEWWRLLTGHLVHSNAEHALWDIAALALIGWVMERQGRLRMTLAVLSGMVAVSAGLWWGLPGLERYCGLSGMLNTLFVIALADLWTVRRHPVIPLIAIGLLLKLAAEITARHSLFVQTLWPSVPEAHLAGCLGALAILGAEQFIALARCIRGHEAPVAPVAPQADH